MNVPHIAWIGALLAFTHFQGATAQDVNRTAPSDDKIDLEVLFTGDPDTERTEDFLALLRKHFRRVQFAAIDEHKHDAPAEYDVVILDSTNFRTKVAGLSRDCGQPTILIGTLGGMVGSRLKLRTNWC